MNCAVQCSCVRLSLLTANCLEFLMDFTPTGDTLLYTAGWVSIQCQMGIKIESDGLQFTQTQIYLII